MSKAPDINDTLRQEGPDAVRARHDRAHSKANGKAHYTIEDIHAIFRKWFGNDYDMATIDAVLAVAAAEKLPGDPPWLLIISGPGNAKTETAGSVSGIPGTLVVSTIASEGALLSASSRKGRTKGATGGLMRKFCDRGILVVKDFTSILSADRNVRGPMLAALREIHDGLWVRNVGTDGGRTISWQGRIVVIAACTTAWDTAHGVVASMGDRFVTIRSSARVGREAAGSRAMKNTGSENQMRQEITHAVAALVVSASLTPREATLTEDEERCLLQAANIVTLARTAVETDYMGNVIDGHEPEMPTRFVKQLVQIFRGALSVGIDRPQALALAMRCARDSVPPLRLSVLRDIDENELDDCRVAEVAKRLQKPWTTIDRTLQTLHVLQLLKCINVDKKKSGEESGDEKKTIRHYTLASDVCLDAIKVSNSSPGL